MKACVIYIVSLLATCLLSYLFPSFAMKENVATTLYTITGIMFSIGLSLTVISSTSNIKNDKIKRRIRHRIKQVRDNFIWAFFVASVIFIFYITKPVSLPFVNGGWLILFIQLASIVFFIVNFIMIQRFNEEIEDTTNQ